MAVPTPTVRSNPVGNFMKEGFPIKVTYSLIPACSVWEKVVEPLGFDQGEPIDIVTQFNNRYMTSAPRILVGTPPVTNQVAYQPEGMYADLLSMQGIPQTITWTYPNGDTVCAYGYIQKVKPSSMKTAEQPIADVTTVITNWDPVNNVEAGPQFASAGGT